MTRHIYFTNRKEYYRRKKISISLIKYYAEKRKQQKIYFINFEIAGTRGYVVGSLSSNTKINLTEGIALIKAKLPIGYKPINFYEAEEEGTQKERLIVVIRNEQEVFVLNV